MCPPVSTLTKVRMTKINFSFIKLLGVLSILLGFGLFFVCIPVLQLSGFDIPGPGLWILMGFIDYKMLPLALTFFTLLILLPLGLFLGGILIFTKYQFLGKKIIFYTVVLSLIAFLSLANF